MAKLGAPLVGLFLVVVVVYVAMRACMVWVQFACGARDVPWWVGPKTCDTEF